VQAFEEGGVFLFDEADALDPNVFLCINSALANGFIHLPNRPENPHAKRHPDFVCILAANTYGTGANRQYCGRNQLDAATLDRFVVVSVDYSREVERALCPNEELLERLWAIRERVDAAGLRRNVSTRFIQRAYKLGAIGWDCERIEGKLFEGWSRDEVRKVQG
jgi:MoxR-like ATPase